MLGVLQVSPVVRAFAAQYAFPLVRAIGVSATVGTVVLCTAEVSGAVWIDRARPELRYRIAIVERSPNDGTRNREESTGSEFVAADWTRRGHGTAGGRSAVDVTNVAVFSIVGFINAAVVAGEQRLIGGAVVARRKNKDVIIGVDQLRVAVVWRCAVALEPPVRGNTPVDAAVIRAPQVDAAHPDLVFVGRINRDHVVIPTLIQELVSCAEAAFDQHCVDWIREQQRVLLVGAGVAHLSGP